MAAPSPDRFSAFTVLRGIQFATIRTTPLLVDIMLPKTLTSSSGPRPVLLNLHGGGLLGGARDFEAWWSVSELEWAAQHSAIVVAPDYALAPESKTPEIVASLELIMSWLQKSLQSTLDEHATAALGFPVVADLAKLAVQGDSAGGWCAMHVGLRHPDAVRVMMLRFPMLDVENVTGMHIDKKGQSLPGLPVPPESVWDEWISNMPEGAVGTGKEEGRFMMMAAGVKYAKFREAFGDSDETYPLRGVVKGARLPKRVWILQGREDPVVPVDGIERSAKLVRDVIEGTEVKLDVRPGVHGFDTEWTIEGSDAEVQSRWAWMAEEWLR